MKSFVLKNSKAFGIFLSVYAMLGALAGSYLIFSVVDKNTGLGAYIVLVPIAAIYLVSLLGGIFYFVKTQRWRFYFLVKLVLCCQVIQLAVKGFTYAFYFGPYLGVGFGQGDGLIINFELLATTFRVYFGDVELQSVQINLLAILLLFVLRWLERDEKAGGDAATDQFLQEDNNTTSPI